MPRQVRREETSPAVCWQLAALRVDLDAVGAQPLLRWEMLHQVRLAIAMVVVMMAVVVLVVMVVVGLVMVMVVVVGLPTLKPHPLIPTPFNIGQKL